MKSAEEAKSRLEVTRLYCVTYGRRLGAAPADPPILEGVGYHWVYFWIVSYLDWLLAIWRISLVLVHGAQLSFLWQAVDEALKIVMYHRMAQSECVCGADAPL